MNKETKNLLIVGALIMAMAIFRVINAEAHIYNLIPMAALGLYSGSVLQNKKAAYLIPLLAMLLSDIGFALFTNTQGFYGISQFVTYIALALVTLLGTTMKDKKVINILGYTLSGSMLFFIVSNFGTFLSGYYGLSFEGFTECFAMALPFYKSELSTQFFINSLVGDILFSGVAFGLLNIATNKSFSLKTA